MTAILSDFGNYIIFSFKFFKNILCLYKRFFEIIRQFVKITYSSVFLIFITSAFTGMVSALQAVYQTRGYIPKDFIGVMIGKATMIELAPVLTGLVLSGKIGASLAAEISEMKLTNQIDALKTMSISPYGFLYFPRIAACIILFPILTLFSNFVGILSAYFLAIAKYHISFHTFFYNMRNFFIPMDFQSGMIKSILFGFFIGTISTYIGSKTQNGAEGVGKSVTNAVIYSSISVLIMDFVTAGLLFGRSI